ncbi:AMP-binding protein [Nocardioides gansuensis]|uniref:AMP-binding protein n=1 Tax=Nocardioides gansuensis TaxID=2138300 RepID=UPI001FE2E5B6|nr:AMP-binding protein [Nocardioides gansuensis]
MNYLRPVHGDAPVVIEALREWLSAADEPAPLVVETSGSTGRPKRVALSRRAVLASVAASARRLGAEGRWLLALPISYVAGLQVACRSLVAGFDPVVVDGLGFETALRGLDTPLVPRGYSTEATVPLFTSLVPTQLHRLLDDPAETAALASLHTVLLGGGPVDPGLRRRAEAAGIHVVATYGASETAGGCVYDGLPLDGVALALGTDGRIRIGGPTLFEGYVDDPELTAQTLVDGWYVTSDAGRLDEDGRLHVLGRVDDVVISGGVNVPLPAVAARLRQHPAVEHAEVLGVPDEEWGQRVVAFVVPSTRWSSSAEERGAYRDHLRSWVADAHPRSWAPRQVVVLDALPLLPNGKPDRRRLEELAR